MDVAILEREFGDGTSSTLVEEILAAAVGDLDILEADVSVAVNEVDALAWCDDWLGSACKTEERDRESVGELDGGVRAILTGAVEAIGYTRLESEGDRAVGATSGLLSSGSKLLDEILRDVGLSLRHRVLVGSSGDSGCGCAGSITTTCITVVEDYAISGGRSKACNRLLASSLLGGRDVETLVVECTTIDDEVGDFSTWGPREANPAVVTVSISHRVHDLLGTCGEVTVGAIDIVEPLGSRCAAVGAGTHTQEVVGLTSQTSDGEWILGGLEYGTGGFILIEGVFADLNLIVVGAFNLAIFYHSVSVATGNGETGGCEEAAEAAVNVPVVTFGAGGGSSSEEECCGCTDDEILIFHLLYGFYKPSMPMRLIAVRIRDGVVGIRKRRGRDWQEVAVDDLGILDETCADGRHVGDVLFDGELAPTID